LIGIFLKVHSTLAENSTWSEVCGSTTFCNYSVYPIRAISNQKWSKLHTSYAIRNCVCCYTVNGKLAAPLLCARCLATGRCYIIVPVTGLADRQLFSKSCKLNSHCHIVVMSYTSQLWLLIRCAISCLNSFITPSCPTM